MDLKKIQEKVDWIIIYWFILAFSFLSTITYILVKEDGLTNNSPQFFNYLLFVFFVYVGAIKLVMYFNKKGPDPFAKPIVKVVGILLIIVVLAIPFFLPTF
jgi:hypothetical protein